MSSVSLEPDSGVIRIAPEFFRLEPDPQDDAALQKLLADRSAASFDLREIIYLDWVMFERLLGIVRNHHGQIRFRGVNPGIRSLFVLHHLELLLEENS